MPVTLPHDASVHGHKVDAVLAYLTVTTAVVFTVMTGILLVSVVFHRGRKRRAHYTHGNGRRDRVMAAVAAGVVLFGIDAVAVVRSSQHLRAGFWRYPDDDPRAYRVEVTARQWAWSFRTAGSDGLFATADDILTLNELPVPVGRPIILQLTSMDVVHSMYLPNFRTKIDAIPGTVTRMWFEARETGVFEIACAQHCGAWHYKMRGALVVMEPEAHDRWSKRAAADVLLQATAPALGAGPPAGSAPTDQNGTSPQGKNDAADVAATPGPASDGWHWNPAP